MTIKAQFMTHSEGRVLDIDEDRLILGHIPSKLRKFDKELFVQKWFDYRFMSPFEATMTYIDHFADVSRLIYRRHFSVRRANYINFHTGRKIRHLLMVGDKKVKRLITGYWRGRQVADAIGMPYDIYVEEVMTSRLRAWKQSHLPTPQQLYNEIDVDKVTRRWKEILDSRLFYSEHFAYLNQNYMNLQVQNDHHEFLLAQVAGSTSRLDTLADLIRRDLLPMEKVVSRLSEDEGQRLRDLV